MTNKEAIEVLTEELKSINPNDLGKEYEFKLAKSLELAIKALENRPQGEWELVKENNISMNCDRCSNCKYLVSVSYYHFCPNCGADMRGGEKT